MREMIAGLCVAVCWVLTPPVDGHTQNRPAMTVVICNQVHLANEALRVIESENTLIFRDADVDAFWIEGESNCTTAVSLPTKVYFVVITSIAPVARTIGPDSMGSALRNDAYRHAYVFYDRVQEFVTTMKLTRDLRINSSLVVGHVIAHELGHLLLHGKGPSGKGIMSELWNSQDLMRALTGRLLFDQHDAKLIKSELSH